MTDDTKIEETGVDTTETTATESAEKVDNQQTEMEKQRVVEQENFRKLRESKEKTERENRELARRLQELESQTAPQQPPEEEITLNPDDLVEGKHLRQFSKKIKALEEQVKQSQQQALNYSVEARIKSQYSDFDEVVTAENVELLKQKEPEMAAALSYSTDRYVQSISAYKLIKQIQKEAMPYQAGKDKIQENQSKPRSSQSISPQTGETPMQQANAFANMSNEDIMKKVREYSSGY